MRSTDSAPLINLSSNGSAPPSSTSSSGAPKTMFFATLDAPALNEFATAPSFVSRFMTTRVARRASVDDASPERERIVTRERAISRVVVAADDADDDGTLNARFGAFQRVHDARDARGDARSRRDDVRSSCARTRARDALDARLARRARETVAVVPFARVARRARERRGRTRRAAGRRARPRRVWAPPTTLAPVSAGPREDLEFAFGADYSGDALSTQGEAVVKGVAAVEDKPSGMALDVDYLQELIAIQEGFARKTSASSEPETWASCISN